MGKDDDDDKREDWFEVMGLKWDATADDVKDAYKKLALKYHPDKNQGDPKAADKFMLVNKAKQFLSDDTKRAKLADKKKKEAERDKRNKKRFEDMNEKRKRFKGDLEAKEAAEKAKQAQKYQAGGGGGAYDDNRKPGINVHILDELRKLGQQQREEEARRMEELLKRTGEAAAAANNGRPVDASMNGEEEEDDEEDSTYQGAGLGGMTGYGTSTTVKIKWKRRAQSTSHSDDSLWRLFSTYGPIRSVELTGVKGNTAQVVFEERGAAEKAIAAYEFNQDMRVTIPADKKYRLFQKPSFDAGTVVGGGGRAPTTGIFAGRGATTAVGGGPGGGGRGPNVAAGGTAGRGGSLFGNATVGGGMGRGGEGIGGLGMGGLGGGGGAGRGVSQSDTLARMRAAAAARKQRLEQEEKEKQEKEGQLNGGGGREAEVLQGQQQQEGQGGNEDGEGEGRPSDMAVDDTNDNEGGEAVPPATTAMT